MRIAILNWRDPWHPQAGGAETYAWEMATRFAGRGWRVTFVTARAPGQSRIDRAEGVGVVRLGGRFTVYPLTLAWLARRGKRFDAVIDCQNGIPYFAPFVHPRVTLLVHHVHDRQFGTHFPAWAAAIGRFLEGPFSRLVYRGCTAVAVSSSTRTAMRVRLRWRGPIEIVHNGISGGRQPYSTERTATPSIVCVGRLVAHKRIGLVLDLAARLPHVPVHIVGSGPESVRLRRKAPGNVTFHGYLPEMEKAALVSRSWLQVNASQGEGWGLSVMEAAALGVPTVAFDVDGLRDAVRDGVTGWLVKPGETFADVTEQALKELAAGDEGYAERCREWAGRFDWDASADRLADVLDSR